MNTKRYTVYDFWHPQCAPCRAFKPRFDEWAKRYKDKADFVAVNIFDDDGAEFAAEVGINTVPTVTVTKDDEEVARFIGAPKEKDLLAALAS